MLKCEIVPVEYVGTPYEVQARRHKKKRINKKWRKRYGYVVKYRDDRVIVCGDTAYLTKRMFDNNKLFVSGEGSEFIRWLQEIK